MPDFWQFPTVSMGLGPLMAIYQARFLKYLESRGLARTPGRKVWVFCGDGEMDEPESLGAIGMAAREGLDNLILWSTATCNAWMARCAATARSSRSWKANSWRLGLECAESHLGRPLGSAAGHGHRPARQRMEECVDGDYQTFKSKDGAYVREHFFGKYPELREMVANMSDDDIWALNRGGYDPHKGVRGLHEATHNANGRPTVILAKTIKGYGMGRAGEAMNCPPGQENGPGLHPPVPRPPGHPHPGRPAGKSPVLQAGRRQPGNAIPARPPQRTGGYLPRASR